MKKLTGKIFFFLIISIMSIGIIGAVTLMITRWITKPQTTDIPQFFFYIYNGLSLAGGLILFSMLINEFIIRKIKKLNSAVKLVSEGNYDIVLDEEGHDELSILSRDFNKMTKELKSNEYLSKEFVKNFSHEMKTPMSSIKGYSDLIGTGTLTPDELSEYSKIISEEAARLIGMSKQMLTLSLIESTSIIKKDETFRPDEQIRRILLLTQRSWQDKKIEIEADMEEFEMTGNEELTYIVWQNLISNAVKYTSEGGKIYISLKRQDEKLFFVIKDNGPGIPEKDQPYIFDQFYTADKSRSGKSTGLGLALVKNILDRLEGTIEFESWDNEGTSFIVSLHA